MGMSDWDRLWEVDWERLRGRFGALVGFSFGARVVGDKGGVWLIRRGRFTKPITINLARYRIKGVD